MSETWAAALRFGVHRLGLSPHQFWNITVAEWRALTTKAAHEHARFSRTDLAQLLSKFPQYKQGPSDRESF